MKIIGVAGQLAQGKDVLCDELCKVLNANLNDKHLAQTQQSLWERGSFARAVKKVYEDSFGVDSEFLEKWKRIDQPPPGFLKPVRQSLQFIGDGFRQIKDNIWIEIALRNNKNLIFSDCRYHNESIAIKEKGGIMMLLYRPGYMNSDPNPSESQLLPLVDWCANNLVEGPIHEQNAVNLSDEKMPKEISNYDYFIKNEGTLSELYNKIKFNLVPYIERVYQNV